jgi:hypothetical protein
MNVIPNLTGEVCESLVKQEFWLEGAKSADVNVLFLKVKNGNWHRFFFDCGPLFWREVEAPDVWNTTPSDLYHYPQIEIGSGLGVAGQPIESVKLLESTGLAEVRLQFANGTLLVLRHFYPQDTMSLSAAQRE